MYVVDLAHMGPLKVTKGHPTLEPGAFSTPILFTPGQH